MKIVDELELNWRDRLLEECSEQNQQAREGILCWLLGDRSRFDGLSPHQVRFAQQAMEYRYRILRQRYLGVSPTQAYRNLINRLGALAVLRNKIRTWVALSRDRKRAVTDVLEEIVQEMLKRDRTIQQQIAWIAHCTQERRLQNSLLLTSLEEYCLRPVHSQPLIVHRFVNYLRRQGRAGMTQVPRQEIVRLISEEMGDEEGYWASHLDVQAVANYHQSQEWEDKQSLRQEVQLEFERYLADKLGEIAVRWLRLYLQGRSQEAIAVTLNLPIKQVYRLREKVSYHALRGFVPKGKPELVANWLEVSLQEHSLGLTPGQWQQYWQNLTPVQRQLIQGLKTGKSLEDISKETQWKNSQVIGEWGKLYQAAQVIRNS